MRIEVHVLNDIDLHFTVSSLAGANSGVDNVIKSCVTENIQPLERLPRL